MYIFGNPVVASETWFIGMDFQKESQIFIVISLPVIYSAQKVEDIQPTVWFTKNGDVKPGFLSAT